MDATQNLPPPVPRTTRETWVSLSLPVIVALGSFVGCSMWGMMSFKHNLARQRQFWAIGDNIVSYCRQHPSSVPLRLEQFVERGVISQADLTFLRSKSVNATYSPPSTNAQPTDVVLTGGHLVHPDAGLEQQFCYGGTMRIEDSRTSRQPTNTPTR